MTSAALAPLVSALAPLGFAGWHTQVARTVAGLTFLLLLGGLGFGLWRARKQVERDEVDAALEVDFQHLERELAQGGVDLARCERPSTPRKGA